MSKSKRKVHPMKFIFYCVLFIVYVLVFPQNLNHFLFFSGIKSDLNAGTSSVVPFRSNSKIGYYDTNGSLLQSQTRLFNSSISDEGYFNYDNLNDPPILYGLKKEHTINIQKGYWPFILRDEILAINSEGTSLAKFSDEGSLIWESDFNSIITFIKSTTSGYLLGLANGTLIINSDVDRKPLLSYAPGGSSIPILLGADFSLNKNRVIIISGLNPQRLIILEKRKSEYRPVYHEDLDSTFNREVFTKISRHSDWGFVEQNDYILVIDMNNFEISELPFNGNIKDVRYNHKKSLFEVLSYNDNNSIELSYYTKQFKKLGSLKQKIEGFFYDDINDIQYWGSDESIGRMILLGE